jgi:hypothetical protein
MRFYLVNVRADGYACRAAFSAASLPEAAKVHVDAYRATRGGSSLVLRAADGRRHSVSDSLSVLDAAARAETSSLQPKESEGHESL